MEEAEHVIHAERQVFSCLVTAMELLDASHLAHPGGALRDERIFEQTLCGHDGAFAAVADCWQDHGCFDELVQSGALDGELAEQLQTAMVGPQHETSLLLRTEPVAAEILLCNTTRPSAEEAELHYVAVVRYAPSRADAARGLQPMCWTYVANTGGRGAEILDWLNEALHRGTGRTAPRVPLAWRLHDVNFARSGAPPRRAELLGAARPIIDEVARLLTPLVFVGAVCFGYLGVQWLLGGGLVEGGSTVHATDFRQTRRDARARREAYGK